MNSSSSTALIGSGPAALMAADVLSAAGCGVEVFEKRKSPGRKLLVAGSSGLNISNSLPLDRFVSHYRGASPSFWRALISEFTPQNWIGFIEELGVPTFEGTSGRYFIQEMKASRFLHVWIERLKARGVVFHFDHECTGFESDSGVVEVSFSGHNSRRFNAVGFALGGGSWEPKETPLRWPGIFLSKGIGFEPFQSSNCGYQVAWSDAFLKEAEGKPLKRIVASSRKATREGDAMVTAYGIEGTPIYFVGEVGVIHLDLRPDFTHEQIIAKLRAVKENLSPIRRVKKQLGLCEASLALLFHHTPKEILAGDRLEPIAERIKAFPIHLDAPQPLAEAISASGGIRFEELSEGLMLKKYPGVFAAGEMLDWDVPTGGFLLQACVAQGHRMGRSILEHTLRERIDD